MKNQHINGPRVQAPDQPSGWAATLSSPSQHSPGGPCLLCCPALQPRHLQPQGSRPQHPQEQKREDSAPTSEVGDAEKEAVGLRAGLRSESCDRRNLGEGRDAGTKQGQRIRRGKRQRREVRSAHFTPRRLTPLPLGAPRHLSKPILLGRRWAEPPAGPALWVTEAPRPPPLTWQQLQALSWPYLVTIPWTLCCSVQSKSQVIQGSHRRGDGAHRELTEIQLSVV